MGRGPEENLTLLGGVNNFAYGVVVRSIGNCGPMCMSRNENYLDLELPGIGTILIILAAQGVFYFVVLFILESSGGARARQLMARCGGRRQGVAHDSLLQPRMSQVGFPDEDVDVQSERWYILTTPLDAMFRTDAIVVYGLTKSFSGFRAVDGLTFRVPQVLRVALHLYDLCRAGYVFSGVWLFVC